MSYKNNDRKGSWEREKYIITLFFTPIHIFLMTVAGLTTTKKESTLKKRNIVTCRAMIKEMYGWFKIGGAIHKKDLKNTRNKNR